ncbi:MAG: hypothetical protein M3081_05105, partial [Gemmatimonadota bacterium]|nr:hypothetical protein [Gemmatimonadota bacterium]
MPSIDVTSRALRPRLFGYAVLLAATVMSACKSDSSGPAPTGTVQANITTTGASLPTGYTVTVGSLAPQTVPVNGTAALPNIVVGTYSATLSGLPANCTVSGTNPVSVTVVANTTVNASFTVVCVQTVGSITVTTTTTGTGIPASFTYAIDAGTAATIAAASGTATVSAVATGTHNVTLTVPSNCTVAATNPRAVTVAVGAVVTAAFTASCITTNPTGVIAVSFYNGTGNWDIYTVWADGTHLTNLTPGLAQNTFSYWPNWSADGTKIVFSRSGDPDASLAPEHLMVMNANGTGLVRLTTPPTGMEDTEPAWSPNGQKIAFARMVGGTGPTGQPTANYDIYTVNADGSNLVRLTNSSSDNGHPRWSPDGTKILFESFRNTDYEIYVMNADGSSPTR